MFWLLLRLIVYCVSFVCVCLFDARRDSSLFKVCLMLFVVVSLLVDCCLLLCVVGCVVFVVRCSLFVVCCSLF